MFLGVTGPSSDVLVSSLVTLVTFSDGGSDMASDRCTMCGGARGRAGLTRCRPCDAVYQKARRLRAKKVRPKGGGGVSVVDVLVVGEEPVGSDVSRGTSELVVEPPVDPNRWIAELPYATGASLGRASNFGYTARKVKAQDGLRASLDATLKRMESKPGMVPFTPRQQVPLGEDGFPLDVPVRALDS